MKNHKRKKLVLKVERITNLELADTVGGISGGWCSTPSVTGPCHTKGCTGGIGGLCPTQRDCTWYCQ